MWWCRAADASCVLCGRAGEERGRCCSLFGWFGSDFRRSPNQIGGSRFQREPRDDTKGREGARGARHMAATRRAHARKPRTARREREAERERETQRDTGGASSQRNPTPPLHHQQQIEMPNLILLLHPTCGWISYHIYSI
jgi:hypothetical protein